MPFERLASWSFAPGSGDLVHDSGRFFSIRGVHVRTNHGHVREWWQPIIHQPEEGILGFLVKELDGVLHFLAQVKVEPGNLNAAQLSPTVQATPSNYLRVHNGSSVPFLEHFVERHDRLLVDVPQSENGSWFLGKRNRNMVVEVLDDVEHDDNFAWLTLGQIHELMLRPNLVNMDVRTVLSCLPLPSPGPTPAWSEVQLSEWLAGRRARYELATTLVPLRSVVGWKRRDDEIRHESGNYFRIVGVSVAATNREVRGWCQPLLEPCGPGLAAFVVSRFEDVLHVLARADVRPGYRDTVEIGPTVQCTPRNFASRPEHLPELAELALSDSVVVRYDVPHSEEGGRFRHAVTRHLIVEIDHGAALSTPPDYFWLTPAQLQGRLRTSCQVNIEARSLLACLQALR